MGVEFVIRGKKNTKQLYLQITQSLPPRGSFSVPLLPAESRLLVFWACFLLNPAEDELQNKSTPSVTRLLMTQHVIVSTHTVD